jgi:Holliday junction resolvase RusA-like endonuclease
MPRVVIEGKPVPKKRPRPNPKGGVWTPSKEAQTWVAYHFTPYRGRYGDQKIMASAVFYCHVRNPTQLPDGDNLWKLVSDAIEEAGVINNDRQITKATHEVVEVPAGQERTVVWFGTREEALDGRT